MEEKRRIFLKILSWTLFILYLVGLFYFLFFSEHYGRTVESRDYRYNFILFREIKRYLNNYRVLGPELLFVNLAGNILAFTPFGFCLPVINRHDNKLLKVFGISILFSFMIETIQLIYKIGSFDVDDLVLNTLGGMIGLFLFRIALRILSIRSRRAIYVEKEEG